MGKLVGKPKTYRYVLRRRRKSTRAHFKLG